MFHRDGESACNSETNFVVRVQWPGNANQYLREIRKGPTIMRLVRVGQRRTSHLTAESRMVQLAFDRMQAASMSRRLDRSVVRKPWTDTDPAGKPAQPAVALIALNATAKLSIGKEAD
jgi:hypothetical protein